MAAEQDAAAMLFSVGALKKTEALVYNTPDVHFPT